MATLGLSSLAQASAALGQALTARNAHIMAQVAQQTSNLIAAVGKVSGAVSNIEKFNSTLRGRATTALVTTGAIAAVAGLTSSVSAKKKDEKEKEDEECRQVTVVKKPSPLPKSAIRSNL